MTPALAVIIGAAFAIGAIIFAWGSLIIRERDRDSVGPTEHGPFA